MREIVLFPQSWLKPTLFALVDDKDYDWLNQYSWSYGKVNSNRKVKIYAYAHINGKMTRMHNLIMGESQDKSLTVDHKNSNTLDNQRLNLRWATKSQQSAGKLKAVNCTSKYKGVYWYDSRKCWMAQLMNNGNRIFIGYYINEKEAALAYNRVAIKYHGEFAQLNIIEE